MATVLDKPDIVEVMEKAGAVFSKAGKSLVCHCPLHSERTPSCFVNPEKQTFKCYGCGEYGDVYSFVGKLRGLNTRDKNDFKEILRILGIENNRPYRPNPETERKKELERQYKEWEQSCFNEVSELYRTWNRLKPFLKTPEQVEEYADFFKQESVWGHYLDILSYVGNDPERERLKLELYRGHLKQKKEDQERESRINAAYEKLQAAKLRLGEKENMRR